MNGICVSHQQAQQANHRIGDCQNCRHRQQTLVVIRLFSFEEFVCQGCLSGRKEWLVFRWLLGQGTAYNDVLERIEKIKLGVFDPDYDIASNTLILRGEIYQALV